MNAVTNIEAATLASAMSLAFGEIEGATKDKVNPHFKSKYADLGSVIDAIKPALIKHGLFFTQHPEPSDKGVTVETILHHACGDSLSLGKLFVPANKQDAQSFGSALTYARRYGLVTAFGVPVEDDDGNAAAKSRVGGGDNSEGQVSPAAGHTEPGATEQPAMPDAEWAKLVQLVEAVKPDTTAMLKHYAVKSLRFLNQAQYAEVFTKLTERLAAMAKEETNKAAGFGEILGDEIPY